MDGTFSRLIVATRGIIAGSVFATTELRLLMIDAVEHTCHRWPTLQITLYVDDATLDAEGPGDEAAVVVAVGR